MQSGIQLQEKLEQEKAEAYAQTQRWQQESGQHKADAQEQVGQRSLENARRADAEAKSAAEARRADAAEAKAQRVSLTARDAAEELRKSWAEIQKKYEAQVSVLRVEKARVEGACEQALAEKEKLQLWITDHMENSKERLLNGQEAVAASERVRDELETQIVELGREILSLQEQIAALERQNRQQQYTAASTRERERASMDAKIIQLHAQMEATQTAAYASRDLLEAEKQKT